jgi:hypothetical protein
MFLQLLKYIDNFPMGYLIISLAGLPGNAFLIIKKPGPFSFPSRPKGKTPPFSACVCPILQEEPGFVKVCC